MLWGYSAAYLERVAEENPGLGTQNVDLSAVPAGYVRVVKDVGAFCNTANPTHLTFQIMDPSNAREFRTFTLSTAAFVYGYSPGWILEATQFIRVTFYGVTTGDDLRASANGYDMAVT